MEDSRPQAILKFHRLSSLDYRVRHELPVFLQFSNNAMCTADLHEIMKLDENLMTRYFTPVSLLKQLEGIFMNNFVA